MPRGSGLRLRLIALLRRRGGERYGRRRNTVVELVPALLELADDALQMVDHRRSRGRGIAPLERGDDRRVVVEGAGAQRRRVEVAFEPGPETAAALVPERPRPAAAARRCRWPRRSACGIRDRRRRASRSRRRCGASCRWSPAVGRRSRRPLRGAARATASPSISSRAARRSKGPGPSSGVAGVPVPLTKIPVPTRTSTRPSISSARMASRTEVRETPSRTASSRSGGSREPTGNSPLSISVAICPAICR